MKAEDMSKLFDIDVDSLDTDGSNDYDVTESDSSPQSFEDRVDDVKSIMTADPDNDLDNDSGDETEPETEPEDETETEDENQVIEKAMASSKKRKKSQPSDDEMEIPGDVDQDDIERQVDEDIANFQREIEADDDQQVKDKSQQDTPIDVENHSEKSVADENPLGLVGSDLKAYQQIRKKFPQFCLYDGNPAFKEFYKAKLTVLKSMLSTFELININDRMEELYEIRLNFFVGEKETPTPDLIRVRIDESYRARVRVSTLLVQALGQFPAWERYCEMLRSKLWKDHELKGAHRRDGLTMEHMSDIEGYVSKLAGFIDQTKHADSMLRAAADSLSRQLTCLQIKEPTGFDQTVQVAKPQNTEAPKPDSAKLEGLDSFDDGSTIGAPDSKTEPSVVDYGVPSDDLADIG